MLIRITKIEAQIPNLSPYIPALRHKFVERFGKSFQEPEEGCERWWAYNEDWTCKIWCEIDGLSTCFKATAKRGGGTDLASVPDLLEGLEKRDNRKGLIPALVHDECYKAQYPFFETANSLFYYGMRYFKLSWLKSKLRYWAVSSPAGWSAWEKASHPDRVAYNARWHDVTEVVPRLNLNQTTSS